MIATTGNTGLEKVVYRRTLEPVTREADRGAQSFSLTLPADPELKVVISTLPGPAQDRRWDWSYVANLTFTTPVQARR